MDARAAFGVVYLAADPKICAAVEDIECFERLDVVARSRMETRFAVFFDDFEAVACIGARDLDDDLVYPFVDVALTRPAFRSNDSGRSATE